MLAASRLACCSTLSPTIVALPSCKSSSCHTLVTEYQLLQERRKAEEQEAAEAEAAAKAQAAQLREKMRQANQKALAKMEKIRSEGRATREAANAAVLEAVRCQATAGVQNEQGNDGMSTVADIERAAVLETVDCQASGACQDKQSISNKLTLAVIGACTVCPFMWLCLSCI